MKKQILRSPLFYVGDKYKLMEEIGTYFPDNIGKFVEPFVGGGSVFMNTVAEQFCLNDIDGYIIGLHKYLSKSANKKNAFFFSFCLIFYYTQKISSYFTLCIQYSRQLSHGHMKKAPSG